MTTVALPLSDQVLLDGSPADLAAIHATVEDLPQVAQVRSDPIVTALGSTPDDPGWFRQSSMADAGFEAAWQSGTGTSDTVIAVIDTGVDPSPDLEGRLLPGLNLVPRGNPAPAGDTTDTSDDNGHGSAVALVAAAAGDDGWGIAGGCWQCSVLPVRVLDADGNGSLATVAEGIRWAVEHGADVVNLSLGGPVGGPDLDAALAEAAAADVVVVGAAGNDGSTSPHYPAAVSSVIAVAGTSTYSPPTVHASSTRGDSWVDVAAPFCNRFDDSTAVFCGTSSATPMVAGMAALVRSSHPELSATAVRGILESTAVPVVPAGSVGAGALRVDLALGEANADAPTTTTTTTTAPPLPAPPEPPRAASDARAPSIIVASPWTWTAGEVTTAVLAGDESGIASVHLDVDGREVTSVSHGGLVGLAWDTLAVTDGWHLVRARAVDAHGNVGAAEVWWPVNNLAPVVRIGSPPAPVVDRTFTVSYDVADSLGIKATLVASGGRWIAVSSGTGRFEATVPVTGPGEVWVVAITVDNGGKASFSNIVSVRSTAKAHRRGRRRR